MLNEFIQFANNNPITAVINEVSREHTGIFKKTMSDSFENYVERSILMDFEKSAHDLQVLKPEATVGDYLDFIEALMQFDVETEQGAGWADAVQVSTIYQAKGDEFDYVFLDGGHKYETVLNDLKNLTKIIENNGDILCDDYDLTYAAGVKKAIDEHVLLNNFNLKILNSRFAEITKNST